MQGKRKAWIEMRVLFASGALFIADQISKFFIRQSMKLGESIEVISSFFHLTYITNDGMAFGINFPFGIYIFSFVSIIFTVFLFWYLYSIKDDPLVIRVALSLIIAGALGNLTDRLFLGEVTDFLDFMIGGYHWYIFNLADSFVTIGMVIMIYDSIFLENKRNAVEK